MHLQGYPDLGYPYHVFAYVLCWDLIGIEGLHLEN